MFITNRHSSLNAEDGTEIIKDKVRLEEEWNDMLSLKDSPARKKFQEHFEHIMNTTLSTVRGFIAVKVCSTTLKHQIQ